MGFVGFLLLTASPGVFLSQQCPVSQYYDGMSWFRLHLTCLGLMIGLLAHVLPVHAGSGKPVSERMWQQVVTEAARLDLPTKFLKRIPPDFVQFEFDDLRTYAAEYHPAEHRLVLNRTLSFNAAGGALRPLTKLTHKELEVLYHELFHAYMDFLATEDGRLSTTPDQPSSLLSFARRQQSCRYSEVAIAPVVQRKGEAETRYLTESESWEALNETWAVFIGWAIWNQLEVRQKGRGLSYEQGAGQWIDRLEKAVQSQELKGYYVPEDPDERRVAQKRFLAGQSQISGAEAVALMTEVLGLPDRLVRKARSSPRLSAFFTFEPSCEAALAR